MACAEVTMAEAKAATANNLIIGFLLWLAMVIVMSCPARLGLTQINSRGQSGACPRSTPDLLRSIAGFGLVPVAHSFAVLHRLPDDLAVRVEADAVAVGRHDAGRPIGLQLFGKLRAFDIEPGFGVDHGKARVEVETASANANSASSQLENETQL